MEFTAFDKILALKENEGAKIQDYGIKGIEVLVILTNGNKYIADFQTSDFTKTDVKHYYFQRSYTTEGYKCLYHGVVPPKDVVINSLKW